MSARAFHQQCSSTDLASRRAGLILWGIPGALLVLGATWGAARPWLWVPSLAVAGAACLANASRCGRLHCFLTGPLFLFGALTTVLNEVGALSIDWRWILAGVIAGTAVGYGLEWALGKYVGRQPASNGSRS